ncbi:MAG: hypothetical protein ACETWM_18850 [Candidatus Lokiarchaeia archaeon]
MKVFENKVCAIWVHFEWGEPHWFELIDKRHKKTLCKGYIEDRTKLYRFKSINDILSEFEKWLEEHNSGSEKDKKKKYYFLPPPNLVPPM